MINEHRSVSIYTKKYLIQRILVFIQWFLAKTGIFLEHDICLYKEREKGKYKQMKKNILVGVSGGIACFKAAALVSKLVQEGYSVRVIMTEGAQKFVTPLTFQALSKEAVMTSVFEEMYPNEISHIDWGKWANLFVIVPATASIIGKCANGIADDVLSTLFLASHAPVWFCPAMNRKMFMHPMVQTNMKKLEQLGYRFLNGQPGRQPCRDIGSGRMMEPKQILAQIHDFFVEDKPFLGKKILITAGPTVERIDPVRYITNDSSGKMGYGIAQLAVKQGAEVTLISGPTNCEIPEGVIFQRVESAEQMFQAVQAVYASMDAVIKVAAVSDYRPAKQLPEKHKKGNKHWSLELERNPDILSWLGAHKKHQILVGFAAETQNAIHYGRKKLQEKNLDLIVVNDVSKPNVGFHYDTNEVVLLFKDGTEEALPLQSKQAVAEKILFHVRKLLEV